MSEFDKSICAECDKAIEYFPGSWSQQESAYWFHVDPYPDSERHIARPKASHPTPVVASKLKPCQCEGSTCSISDLQSGFVCMNNLLNHPTPVVVADEELYYVQDKRQYCGNSVFWWRPEGNGYTCDLDKAWKVTREKAERMMRHRPDVDVAWPVALVDAGAQRHFDMQDLREMKSL